MKEITFLKQNQEKWESFEKSLFQTQKHSPDELAELYIQLNDDLSYAKTFYPNSKTTKYLNGLTGKTHQHIYKNKPEHLARIGAFWKTELPLVMFENRRYLIYTFIIFVLSVLTGVVSAAYDDTFVRLILGDFYTNMTESNISGGDPMAVYKQTRELPMALGITLNNILVSVMIYVNGVFLGIMTVYQLFTNSIMIGVFHYFFYERGLLETSLLAVYIHGTLEISAIIIASVAGLLIGKGILFPGTYKRSISFIKGVKDGLKIIIGLMPVFVLAGFLEGFVTRLTLPFALNLLIIILSLSFIIGYFVIYPIFVHKNHQIK